MTCRHLFFLTLSILVLALAAPLHLRAQSTLPLPAIKQNPSITVAVAANFTGPAEQLARYFESQTQTKVLLVSGATGKLVTQIEQEAPFDVFLSADQEHVNILNKKNLTVPASQYTYAIGKIFLYSANPKTVDSKGEVLNNSQIQHLAIANPELAPYGAAAKLALEKLNLWASWEKRLVIGESIGQAFQFVATGNAEIGFVAGSQLKEGSSWEVPTHLYAPLKQDAVLLKRASANSNASAFLKFLRGPEAQKIIVAAGYRLSDPPSVKAKGK